MATKKAGTILLNLITKQVGLIYQKKCNGYAFPKGHWEEGETLEECAIRETEEETLRANHLLISKEICVLKYATPTGENVENHMYIAIDDGPTSKSIPSYDTEIFEWVNFEDVDSKLSFSNLKDFWNTIKNPIHKILENQGQLEPAILTDLSICPTCYDKENNHCLYGNITEKMLFENDDFECFLVGSPRANGHTIISTKKHYKDLLEIPDELCKEIFVFAKKIMNILKKVYDCESVYLCTMCDGPMKHFHIQLIPRYAFEVRGSKNFVKPRKNYIEDKEKIEKIRELIKE